MAEQGPEFVVRRVRVEANIAGMLSSIDADDPELLGLWLWRFLERARIGTMATLPQYLGGYRNQDGNSGCPFVVRPIWGADDGPR